MTIVEYEFESERSAILALIPNPIVNDGNLTLLRDEVWPLAVGIAPDGQTPVYRIGGRYRYAAKQSRNASFDVQFGIHKLINFLYDTTGTVLPQSNFVHGLIDSTYGSAPTSPGDGGGPTGPSE
jgi:hypothetical protein